MYPILHMVFSETGIIPISYFTVRIFSGGMKVTNTVEEGPEFPTLSEGVNTLKTESKPIKPLQSLVLNQLIIDDGKAVWVDANNNGSTQVMYKLAPSKRFLDRVRIARAFTPFQHYGVIHNMDEEVDENTSVIVLPEIDWFFSGDETEEGEGESMLKDSLLMTKKLVKEYGVPAVTTFSNPSFSKNIAKTYTDETIACKVTGMGPRFVSSDFETMVYRGNGYVQTTLAFWERELRQKFIETRQKGGVVVGAD